MTNATADAYQARELAKTPEQLAAEKAQNDALELQRRALALQVIRDRNAALAAGTKVEIAPPKKSVNCTSRTVGDTTYTDCN
jgi:hypothetical protein